MANDTSIDDDAADLPEQESLAKGTHALLDEIASEPLLLPLPTARAGALLARAEQPGTRLVGETARNAAQDRWLIFRL